MGMRLGVLVAAASVALMACGDDERPPSFQYIHTAIIEPNCTTSGCHSGLSEAAGLDFESMEDAYVQLTGRACGDEGEGLRRYINPGQPENSQLMYLLLGLEVPTPMPPDVALPDADIDLIEQWILEGAPCN